MVWLVLHAAATLAMTGLVWFVQLVHYPLFALVDRRRFPRFELMHRSRASWIIAPLMLIEGTTAAVLLVAGPPQIAPFMLWLNVGLLGLVWISTFFWQMPLHSRLSTEFRHDAYTELVSSNWLRTAAWTIRSGLLVWIMLRVGEAS